MTAAFDADHYESFDDLDEAAEWAARAAEASGMAFIVVEGADEFRAGPVDEVDVVAGSMPKVAIVAVFDADGEPSQLLESMFSDDSATDAELARMSAVVRAARDIGRPQANEARVQRSFDARAWRQEHMHVLEGWNALTEMEVKNRRTLYTRRQALLKKKTVKDGDRQRVARNAKNWRLRNKSKAKRYGSLYRGPHTKVKEAAVDTGSEWEDVIVDTATGEVVREATITEIEAAIAGAAGLVIERRRKRQATPVVAPVGNNTPPHIPVLASDAARFPAGGGL